ncbi:MAG: DUF4136 domain-containing protein [Dysgonamonadaceae bacterium]|jgi:hypothetical protein|nr:DUF4136 domain-containing protein [Dysgonamonadaceae bacterium]
MKPLLLFLVSITVYSFVYSKPVEEYVCQLGFTFEMSQQAGWGQNKPVVIAIQPLSPADAAGLKVNDIIESINFAPTEGQMVNIIHDWLYNNTDDQIRLTVSNLKYSNKDLTLFKDCKLANAINEKDLAYSHAFYSLEDVQLRNFTCPFKTNVNSEVNLMKYKTFTFPMIDENHKDLENIINEEIKSFLEKIGLTYVTESADLIVHTYYSYNKNLNYEGNVNADKFPTACRYNVHSSTIETLPIYYHPLINQRQAQYFLNFGIRLIDRRRSANNNLFVVWECEANEMLSGDYRLEAYSKFHIPLMLMQYPYIKTREAAHFSYKKIKYNYTGLNYNIDNLKEIVDIDRFSPAYQASIRPGDEVERICGIKLEGDSKEASNAYKQFIYKTMPLRDSKTTYTDASGFTKCMFWDKFQYVQVAEAFKNPEYKTMYAYLFYFEPYINLSGTNILFFEIKRGKDKFSVKVTPTVRVEQVFENYK